MAIRRKTTNKASDNWLDSIMPTVGSMEKEPSLAKEDNTKVFEPKAETKSELKQQTVKNDKSTEQTVSVKNTFGDTLAFSLDGIDCQCKAPVGYKPGNSIVVRYKNDNGLQILNIEVK